MSLLVMRPVVLSEVGPRSNNEDAVFGSPRLVAVADGVGGAATGEVASRLAVSKMMGLDSRRLSGSLEELLRSAVFDANEAVGFAATYHPRHVGMATTITAVALSNESSYVVANVGDSRAYLMREGTLLRLTRDDSLVQQLVDQGSVTEEEARSHPQRSVVLKVLNGDEQEFSPVQTFEALAGDRLLLCSDGVTDYLTDPQVAAILQSGDVPVAARALVDAALDNGGRDNVSAVLADIELDPGAEGGWLELPPQDR
jgi:serine/threonine protein phosphatase PrpC